MSNRRTLMAAAAIVLALVAGLGVYFYVSGADRRAQESAGFVDALVATSDIAKGTTGREALQAGLVAKEKVARGSIPPSIVTDAGALLDKVASGRIDSKQFITSQTFVSVGEGSGGPIATAIAKRDLVAVTVSVDPERGVANEIAPGDHVNLAVLSGADKTATYLLQNVKVLAVGATTVATQADGTQAAPPTSNAGLLTFEVTPDDALRVIEANKTATLYLVLLPPASASAVTAGSGGTKTPAAAK